MRERRRAGRPLIPEHMKTYIPITIPLLLFTLGCRETVQPCGEAVSGVPVAGPSPVTTTDPALQEYAATLFSDKEGYLVALDPGTGGVLALVTTPEEAAAPVHLPLTGCGDRLPVPSSALGMAACCAAIAGRGHVPAPWVDKGADPFLMETAHDPEYYDGLIETMWRDVNGPPGTGARAWIAHVDGLDVCGRVSGEGDGPDSFFIGFAPRESPRIAVAVCVRGGGTGARYAAPIGSLVIERHLTGEVRRPFLEGKMIQAWPMGGCPQDMNISTGIR